MQFKGMPMTPQMATMGFAPAPPGMNAPHGYLPVMPQQALPFAVPPNGAPPSPMRGGHPGTRQLLLLCCADFCLMHACVCQVSGLRLCMGRFAGCLA